MTDMEFQNAAEKAGYEVMDSTEQFAAYDHIENASIAIKDNDYQVEFYTTSNSASAASMFQTNQESFETTKGSKTKEGEKSGKNYQSYSLLTNEKSFSFSRKILAAPGKSITCVLTAVTNSWNRLDIQAGMICQIFPFRR